MKLVKQSRLHYQEGKSDKVYQVDLVETSAVTDEKYLVNYRYGRQGGALREGTKTTQPVTRERAEKLFNSIVVSKVNKGYKANQDYQETENNLKPATSISPNTTSSLIERIKNETNDSARARQIWRLPPQKNPDAATIIVKFLGRDNWRYDYNILWTLGRVGSQKDLTAVTPFLQHENEILANLALEVTLALTPATQRYSTYNQLCDHVSLLTPQDLNTQLAQFHSACEHLANKPYSVIKTSINDMLKKAYLQSWFDQDIRQALITIVPDIPFIPGAFKGLRYLLKMSEFRLDAELYSLLNFHLESSRPYFQRDDWSYYIYTSEGRITIDKELVSDSARLAYSQRTQRYFIARYGRTLRQLGINQSLHYTDIAEQTLLKYSGKNAVKPRTYEGYEYDDQWQRHLKTVRYYDEYAHCSALNQLIRSQNPGYTKNRRGIWSYTSEENFEGRGEAFPHLWDKAPDSLLRIALGTECPPVSDFAIRALSDNSEFCDAISGDDLVNLLLKPFQNSQQFALQQLKSRQLANPLPPEVIVALFSSTVVEVIEFAIEQLNKQRESGNITALLAQLLCVDNDRLRHWLNDPLTLNKISTLEKPRLLSGAVEAFNHYPLDEHTHLDWVFDWLMKHCGSSLDRLTLQPVEQLIHSSSTAKMLLGCKILNAMPVNYAQVSESTLDAIQAAKSKQIQSYSISLLKKLKPVDLAEKLDYLLNSLLNYSPLKQAAIFEVLTESITSYSHNRKKVLNHCLDLLHRRELEQSLQQKLVHFLQQNFTTELSSARADVIWLLASARSEQAHLLAVEQLEDKSSRYSVLSPQQWLELLSSSTVQLRELARRYFTQSPHELVGQMDNILTVMESPWPDTQEYVFDFCSTRMTQQDWQPEQIVAVCDSVVEPVQQFGRDLIQHYFDDGDGKQYLLWLSQHPSANVELFVSQFLTLYASDDEAIILALKPYFLSVLSRVNSGRVAKDRVIQFLYSQAHITEKVLNMVCELLTRLSLTSVQKDKAEYIKLMLVLKKQYQDVSLPLQLKSLNGVKE